MNLKNGRTYSQATDYEDEGEENLLPQLHLKIPYVGQRHREDDEVCDDFGNGGAEKVMVF